MALRAGYYGLKNSVKKALEKLASDMAGAKIIKSVGDGLSLSDQGALTANIKSIGDGLDLSEQGSLSVDIDSDTMEFKNGKLAAKSAASDIDTIYTNPGSTPVSSMILTGNISDYDMIVFDLIRTGGYHVFNTALAADISDGYIMTLLAYTGLSEFINLSYTESTNSFDVGQQGSQDIRVAKITGIKY